MQSKVWKYVGFASAVVGLLCYARSSSFNYLFGEWNLLKIFLFVVFSFITCVVILFAETGQHSRSHLFKAHNAFLVLTITSVYSFFFDKVTNGKPAEAYSLISCAAFAVMSLSLSKQTQCGLEVDLLNFFLGCLIIQLMKTELPLVIVGVGFSYFLLVLRSYFSSRDAAARDNVSSGLPVRHHLINVDDQSHPGLPDDNSADPDDSLQVASFSPAVAAAPDNSGLPDDNSADPDVDSRPLASTEFASSTVEQLSRPPAAAVNVSGYFQDAGPDAMPGNPYQQQQLHQRQSRRKLERTHTVLLTTYDPFEFTRATPTIGEMFDEIRPLLLRLDSSPWAKEIGAMLMKELLGSVIKTLMIIKVMLTEDVRADDGLQATIGELFVEIVPLLQLDSPPWTKEKRVKLRRSVIKTLRVMSTEDVRADDWLQATIGELFDEIRPLLHLDSPPWAKEKGVKLLDSVIKTLKVMFTKDVRAQVAAKSRERLQVAAKSRERVQLPAAKDRRSSYKKTHMLTNSRQHLRHRSSRAKE